MWDIKISTEETNRIELFTIEVKNRYIYKLFYYYNKIDNYTGSIAPIQKQTLTLLSKTPVKYYAN